MNKSSLIKAACVTAVSAIGAAAAKNKLNSYFSVDKNRRKLYDVSNAAVQKVFGAFSDSVSDSDIPYLNRYDNTGFLEGSGYFLPKATENAMWSAGFAKASILPPDILEGEYYIGGYLAFPPNRVNGIITDQLIRAVAFDDGSGRGINVFAVIDCVGISNTDVRAIRMLLRDLTNEKNIVSINISATHCHSGVDTQGLWGDLIKAIRTNPKAIKSGNTQDTVSGRNAAFMEFLHQTAADTIKNAVNSMRTGTLSFAPLCAADFVRDKRPPYVTDDTLTVLKFTPDNVGERSLAAVIFAAHPTCYGARQREISADFPYYMCDELEKNGLDAMFFQGDEAAVATDRGKHSSPDATGKDSIEQYGRALARFVLSAPENAYEKISPLLNVIIKENFLPSDNKILELAGKLRLINNHMTKVSMETDDYDMYFATETGYAEFGEKLRIAMIPGELMPELAVGGVAKAYESYNDTEWEHESLKKLAGGVLAVIGLCNDSVGYIVPDNDFGSAFAPLHYEECASAGERTASNTVSAFERLLSAAKKITYVKTETEV